jgi:hypothetical protein
MTTKPAKKFVKITVSEKSPKTGRTQPSVNGKKMNC